MKDGTSFEAASLDQRPDLADRFGLMSEGAWPKFLLHADTLHWGSLFDEFVGFQIAFVGLEDAVIAIDHTAPFVWDGTSEDLPLKLDGVLGRALEDRRLGRNPNALSALAAIVRRQSRSPARSPNGKNGQACASRRAENT